MLDRFKQLFVTAHTSPGKEADLRLAAALLLVEVARADYSADPSEGERLLDLLQRQFDLAEDEVTKLVNVAEDAADGSISLHRYLDLINGNYTPEQKIALLKMMWDVAYADGELHHYEEHLIRRIADLLYISHKDFIRTKHQVIRSR